LTRSGIAPLIKDGRVTVHAFVDESARPPRYLVSAAIVEPAHVRRLRQSMRALLLPGQREPHFKKEKTPHTIAAARGQSA
jgi:hypothetical protein